LSTFEKWSIHRTSSGYQIESRTSLLAELFEKSPDWKAQKEYLSDYTFELLSNVPGKFYPKIYRPQYVWDNRDSV